MCSGCCVGSPSVVVFRCVIGFRTRTLVENVYQGAQVSIRAAMFVLSGRLARLASMAAAAHCRELVEACPRGIWNGIDIRTNELIVK